MSTTLIIMNTKKDATYKWLLPCISESKEVSEDAKALINHLITLRRTKAKALETGIVAIGNKDLLKQLGWYQDKLNNAILECQTYNFFTRKAGKKWHKGEKRTASEYIINFEALRHEPVAESLDSLYDRLEAVQPKTFTEEQKMQIKPYTPAPKKVEEPVEDENEEEEHDLSYHLNILPEKTKQQETEELIQRLPDDYACIDDKFADYISGWCMYLDGEERGVFENLLEDKYGAGTVDILFKRGIEYTKQTTNRH